MTPDTTAAELSSEHVDTGFLRELETMIKQNDLQSFFDHLKHSYVPFIHKFGILAISKFEAEEKMGHCANPKCLLDLLTPNHEAFVVLVVVNNHDGWSSRKNLADGDATRRRCIGRWTRVIGGTEDDASTTSSGSSSKKGAGRKTYSSGWSDDGLDFYRRAVKFFGAIRKDPRAAPGDGCYYNDVLDHYLQKRQGRCGGKRKRDSDFDNDEAVADYGDWEEL